MVKKFFCTEAQIAPNRPKPQNMAYEVDSAVATMLEKNGVEAVKVAAPILSRIFGNILAHPTEPKFRRLRKDNKQLAAKVLSARGARALLLAAGFEFEQSSGIFLLPEKFDRGRLEHCQLVVGGVIDAKMAQMAAKSAAEREARLAEVRRENAERQARLAHLREAAARDQVARRDPRWKPAAILGEKNGREVGRLPSG